MIALNCLAVSTTVSQGYSDAEEKCSLAVEYLDDSIRQPESSNIALEAKEVSDMVSRAVSVHLCKS